MKTFCLSISFILLFAISCSSQSSYDLPKGYTLYKNYEEKPFRFRKDVDGDGITDLVLVLRKNRSEENIVAVFLSTTYSANKTFYFFPFTSNSYVIEFKNNVLSVGSCFGTGRYCKTLKFRFYPGSAGMRLIGYDEESFGNAGNEGAYLKTVNLLNNKYELSGPKWNNKLTKSSTFPIITLDNIDEEKLDYLENIGYNFLQ